MDIDDQAKGQGNDGQRRGRRGFGRGRGRGQRGRGNFRGRGGRGGSQPMSVENLDDQLTKYMMKDEKVAQNFLDSSLESYMAQRNQAQQQNQAQATATAGLQTAMNTL
jgi:hypothetical protein